MSVTISCMSEYNKQMSKIRNMKKGVLIVMGVLMLSFLGIGQQVVSRFNVEKATFNHKNLGEEFVDQNVFTMFYTSPADGKLCMANVVTKTRTKSFGSVYDYKWKEKNPLIGKEKTVFRFKWDYENTYDRKKGTADVTFTRIHELEGDLFVMKIVLENKDVIVFKGSETHF